MPRAAKLFPILLSAGLVTGCVSVSAGGAIVGAKTTVSGNSVETTTTVRSASVGVSVPGNKKRATNQQQ